MNDPVEERFGAEPGPPPTSAPERHRQWGGIDLSLFGGFFIFSVVFLPSMMIRGVQALYPEFGLEDITAAHSVILQAFVDLILVAFIFFLVRKVHGFSFREEMGWSPEVAYRTIPLVLVGAGLAVSVMIVAALFPPSEPPPIESMLSTPGAIWTFALFGIAFAPILEELIFRGFLFRVFDQLAGPSVAVSMTAVLFASLHIPQLWGSWTGILLILGVGYVLSALRRHSRSIIPPIIVHVAYNSMLFFAFALSTLVQESGGAI